MNIKVDREQRPDIDAVYMLATTLMTGRGGWPNNVFLMPDLKPFFAGSYFPPEEGGDGAYPSGSSALVELLLRLALVPEGARHLRAAERALAAHSGRVAQQPERWPILVAAAARLRTGALARHAGVAAAPFELLDTASRVQAQASLRRLPAREEIVVRLRIAPGFHVNANPASYDYLVPTAVRFEALEPARVRYPEARLFKPGFERRGLAVCEGEVEIVAELPAGTLAADRAVRGEVRVQACDDTVCLPPSTLPVVLQVP